MTQSNSDANAGLAKLVEGLTRQLVGLPEFFDGVQARPWRTLPEQYAQGEARLHVHRKFVEPATREKHLVGEHNEDVRDLCFTYEWPGGEYFNFLRRQIVVAW